MDDLKTNRYASYVIGIIIIIIIMNNTINTAKGTY